MAGVQKIGNVYFRVSDMDAAVEFYQNVLGLNLKFRDGNNWTAFDVAGVTLALEGGHAAPAGAGGATVSLKVDDLDAFAADIRAKGARVGDIVAGGHERRATVTDPSGNQLVLYGPLK